MSQALRTKSTRKSKIMAAKENPNHNATLIARRITGRRHDHVVGRFDWYDSMTFFQLFFLDTVIPDRSVGAIVDGWVVPDRDPTWVDNCNRWEKTAMAYEHVRRAWKYSGGEAPSQEITDETAFQAREIMIGIANGRIQYEADDDGSLAGEPQPVTTYRFITVYNSARLAIKYRICYKYPQIIVNIQLPPNPQTDIENTNPIKKRKPR